MATLDKDGELRIGVFVCDCGLNIAGAVDTAAVCDFAETLDDVACVVRNKYTCADPGQNEIKAAVAEHRLNRVVVASCTPRQHEPTFRQCVLEAGLNPEGVRRLLAAPWLADMASEILETPEFCEPEESPEQLLGYARDVVGEYIRKRFPL